MKPYFCLLCTFIFICGIMSCKKNNVESRPTASLTVINAVIGGGNVKLNTNYRDSVKKYNARSFGLNALDGTIRLYSTTDSLKPYYLQQHKLKDGAMYSMLLFGNPESPEHLFMEESAPAPYADSIFGVRVVNLASGTGLLNISRASDESSNIFSEIDYKEMTEIATFPLPLITSTSADAEKRKTVTFQVRDAAGVVLAIYALPVNVNNTYPGISVNSQRFKNITLVIKGIAGVTTGPDALGVFPVPVSY